MITVKSQRARTLLERPRAFKSELTSGMRRYPGESLQLWVEIEGTPDHVKNLSFYGEVEPGIKVLLESMASLMIGKDLSRLSQISLRECEAFLRDRNSEYALESVPAETEFELQKLFDWVRRSSWSQEVREYHFHSEKGPFRNLKLADKVRELKGFLNSPDVLSLYRGLPRPEVVDVEGMDVFLEVPWQTEREKALLDELHALGVETFQEENLNFIPEA